MTTCTNSVISHLCSDSNQAGPGSQTLSSCGKWDQICYEEKGWVMLRHSNLLGWDMLQPLVLAFLSLTY